MQEVLIDVTRLLQRFYKKRLPTGVDRVSLAYIKHYRAGARAVARHKNGKFVFRRAESERIFDWVLSLGKDGNILPTIGKGMITGCASQRVRGQFLFNTGHSGLESDNYIRMLKEQRVRPIFMVHDVIPVSHPQFCRAGERDRHLARLQNAMRIAHGIVFNSQATMNEMRNICQTYGWTMPPSTVALLAPELPAAWPAFRPMIPPYFVFVSTLEPRKNHLMILKIWCRLAERLGDRVPRLVIIGQRGWDFDEVTSLLSGSETLKQLVIEIPACSDADMVNYLQEAQALLFPSFTEGYGMPIIEALIHGVPVIASDLPVFREFAGNIPEYIHANDSQSWEQAVLDYGDSGNARRLQQLARMRGFVAPSWVNHFAKVDALLGNLSTDEFVRA